jgi:tRNA pseudouridine38-40 synthase
MTLFDAEPEPPAAPVVRVRLTVAYDGHGFHGFAAQPGVRTVGGALADAIRRVLGHAVELTVAGRTDRGVHAWGQVVSFDASAADGPPDLDALQRSVNRQCGPALAIRDACIAAPAFDARFDAIARCYRYTLLADPVPDPFLASTTWHVAVPLDLDAMRLACDPLVGEHDFASFCRRPDPDASLVRRVTEATWERDRDDTRLLRFWIEADSFCHQMVRSLVGTLVDVGRGKRRAGEVAGILRAADRAGTGNIAPPHGLCLWAVRYPA